MTDILKHKEYITDFEGGHLRTKTIGHNGIGSTSIYTDGVWREHITMNISEIKSLHQSISEHLDAIFGVENENK